jgi:hypothetical protein
MNPNAFPRYTDFNPRVPVYCVTPKTDRCLHRFFDTWPISPSGRFLAVFRLPFEDRRGRPGETGEIFIVDLESGEERKIADTCGWEPQMGANLNWGGSDHELFYNDVDVNTWKPFAWKHDLVSGKRDRMEGGVYHASPDGRFLICSNPVTMRKTQPGYGVQVPDANVPWHKGPVDDDGFWITDTRTGKCRLLASIRQILDQAEPKVKIGDASQFEIYGFHSKFNSQGDRLMLSLRWFPLNDTPQFDLFKSNHKAVRYAWVTMTPEGREIRCAVGPEEWEKGGHHATFFPDGKRISMNLNIDRDVLRLVQVNVDGSGYGKMTSALPGSGHPTVHPDGRHVLTDTYTKEPTAFGDGTIPLRWIDLEKGTEECLVRINTQTNSADGVMRVDPHPAWDRTWRYVTFNAFIAGTRRVFIADMKDVTGWKG